MTDPAGGDNRALEELDALRQELARLQAMSAEYQATEARLAQLAVFPEQNPDILVEIDTGGRVLYLNLIAQLRFPEIWQQGFDHPLLHGLHNIVRGMERDGQPYSVSEVGLSDAAFERQICLTQEHGSARIRIYAHDITQRKRAEVAIHRLAKQVVYAQEDERKRLSRELHDEAGQALTALKLRLELLRADLPMDTEMLRSNLAEAIALTESTKERVRLLAHDLRPPALDTVGLNLTLEALCRDISQRTPLRARYTGCEEVKDLSDAVNICLYRVLQEALTNVVKHAWAQTIDVRLVRDGATVTLSVADDGRGFTEPPARQPPEQQGGIGLLGMSERLELLGGSLHLHSSPGQGLRLTATLPLVDQP
jgi:signal transduction histidine kinase